MKTACIIPARGGSVRIPGKNIKLFHGRPMLHYAIATAWNSRLFDRVIVSTDDNEIASVVNKFGSGAGEIQVFRRKTIDPLGKIGTQDIAREVLLDKAQKDISIACVLYPCTPLLNWGDLLVGYRALLTLGQHFHVYTLATEKETAADAGGFYWGFATAFMQRMPITPETSLGIQQADHFDINTPEDWQRASDRYAEMQKRAAGQTETVQ